MKVLKTILIFLSLFFLPLNSFGEEIISECKNIKNFEKRITCKANLTKEKVGSKLKKVMLKVSSKHEEFDKKKTIADWFKKKKE